MNSEKTKKRILDYFLEHPNLISKIRVMAKALNIPNREYQSFKRLVKQLGQNGYLKHYKGNHYGQIQNQHFAAGVLHVKTQGYGFLIRDGGGEDIFVSQKNMGRAFHRDRVKVEFFARSPGKLQEGKVIEVLERGRERVVGRIEKSGSFYIVIPDDLKINRDIYIDEKNRKGAKPNQKVVVEIIQWHDIRSNPEGRVVQVLGYPDEKGVDVLSVAYGFDLQIEFPDSVNEAVEILTDELIEEGKKNRLDIRNKLIFTIDPEEAKDHDDAVSLECLTNGNFLLGVHIADVSSYVEVGSVIDIEAMKRGTSFYLIDRVIPMLPERLSNDLCSLKPNKDRLAFSVIMELTPEGYLEDYQIRETLIRSQYRLSYNQVQSVLDENRTNQELEKEKIEEFKFDPNLVQTLQLMYKLSHQLREEWRKMGSIQFEAPEPLVELDENGTPTRLGVKPILESHKLIEAFMLLANQTVAKHIEKLRKRFSKNYPFVYRVHGKPRGKKLESFVQFVRALGYNFNPGNKITSKKFQRFLEKVRGTPHEIIIEEVALRTMMKAEYSTQNIGHFGLGFKHYTHFTSPIRRYPDLMVHRLLKDYEKIDGKSLKLPMKLSRICKMVTDREIIAQDAERESVLVKQVEFMEKHIGDEFDGVISGIVSFGFFVEITQYLVDGLVHVEDLKDDYYLYDEKHYRLIGQHLGRIYQLGDSVKVRILRTMKEQKRIDFTLINQ